ncbi:MAG: hypothetical protein HOU81_13510 [Hamadaea sp.]|uniref:hypothetical protein n=1 Tax=Hamadaea sp. TaxID=2024425 RepID=UPI0017DEA89E|nr:hypothetical protein [Hamadaea sp.]NUR71835.1 hypothetical protein [Hamadaea sp.]NUT24128.1 hypothetical protein [Hamadaea sp.]
MRTSWLARAAAIAATGLIFLLVGARPALAADVIPINPGNVPTTASGFGTHQCGDFGDGPLPDQDIWVFVLPNPPAQGDFVTVTVTFKDQSNVLHEVNATVVMVNGTSKAWAATPAGWTLTGGTASITGTGTPAENAHFNLTHTCPASGSPSPSPSSSSPSPSPSVSISPLGGSESPSTSASTSPMGSPGPSESTTPGQSTSAAPVPSGSVNTGGGGSAVGMSSVFLGGGALLGAIAGIGFLLLARQRRDLA